MLKENGVGTEVHYPIPLHLQPASALAFSSGKPPVLPQVERATQEIVSLPIYPMLTKAEISYVVSQIKKWESSTAHR